MAKSTLNPKSYDVVVVGGAGHVGAPLAVVLASRGLRTLILDTNEKSLEILASGKMPFLEKDGDKWLQRVLAQDKLGFSSEAQDVRGVPVIILTIGTPIDEYHNPIFSSLLTCLDSFIPYLNDDQTIVLRSTVAPGVTKFLDRYLRSKERLTGLAFCPERVVQGRAIEEIQTLPQLVSATSGRALETAKALFSQVAPEVIEVTPEEAEYAKLICNAYRYIQFAATNQLFELVTAAGLDYGRLLKKMKQGYARMEGIPSPGFAAGPCLMKDTMQLFAFNKENFTLGQAAMLINEGLPNFMVDQLRRKFDLTRIRVGVLGMAFKADSDDIRDSLSYKLCKLLAFHGATVKRSDEFVQDPDHISKEALVESVDILIIGVPHSAYLNLTVPKKVHVVDLWGLVSQPIGDKEENRNELSDTLVAPGSGGRGDRPSFRGNADQLPQ